MTPKYLIDLPILIASICMGNPFKYNWLMVYKHGLGLMIIIAIANSTELDDVPKYLFVSFTDLHGTS